jgi:Na+/H+ antiporter NhaD/arsenite permease-like protein
VLITGLLLIGTVAASDGLFEAVLLSARRPAHPRALLIGLDLGPNLVITGSLSAIFWMGVARAERARPSALTYSKVGLVLVPLSVTASLLALSAFSGAETHPLVLVGGSRPCTKRSWSSRPFWRPPWRWSKR